MIGSIVYRIAAMLFSHVAGFADADFLTTSSDDWLSSGCTTRCICSFAESLVSTLPLRTANCSYVVFSSTKFHLSRETESLVVSGGNRIDLPILTAVMFRDGNLIRQLVLRRSRLQSFDGLAAPDTLESVDASHNELVSLPDATFIRLSSLQLLDLSHNRLEVIHRYAFAGLDLLRHLDVSGNHLSGAFEGLRWVCELPRLEELNLSHNGIHVVDDSMFACDSLSSTSIRGKSESIGYGRDSIKENRTHHLRLLDLSRNRIRHVHSRAFLGLGRVDVIRLNDNALQGLPLYAVQMSPDVEVWDLSGNEVEILETNSFTENEVLRELRLNHMNRLRIIDRRAFVNLTSLRRVELSDNRQLRYISPTAFVDVPSLSSLVLTGSAIETLEREVVANVPALTALRLNGTRLRCDCIARSLFQHIRDTENLTSDIDQGAVCQSPNNSFDVSTTASYHNNAAAVTDRSDYQELLSSDEVPSSTSSLTTTSAEDSLPTGTIDNVSAEAHCRPRIVGLFDTSVHATVADVLRIDCRAVGFPEPTVSWVLPVAANSDVTTDDDMTTSFGTQVTVSNGTLLISAVAMRHHGNYTCLVDNSGNHGDRRSVYVHVTSQRTSLILLHVTSSVVTFSWRGLHASREYRIRYREKRRDLNETVPTTTTEIPVKPYMRSFSASDLRPETQYTFCIDIRQSNPHGWSSTPHRGRFVAVGCTRVTTRHRKFGAPLSRSLAVHILTGAAATLGSLGLLFAVSTLATRRYDRRKLRQAALQSASVSSGGILLQRDDDAATGTGNMTSSGAAVTFENRAALAGVGGGDSDDLDYVAMFDSDDLDEIRTTATMKQRL